MSKHGSNTAARCEVHRQMLPQGQKLCAQTRTATFKRTQNGRILRLLMGSDGSGDQTKESMIQTEWISKIQTCESPSFEHVKSASVLSETFEDHCLTPVGRDRCAGLQVELLVT